MSCASDFKVVAQPDHSFLTDYACPLGRSWLRSAVSYVRDEHCPVRYTFVSTDSGKVFRNQDINIHEQLDLGRHWGPLHKHATTAIPQESGLEEVHGSSSVKGHGNR